MFLFLERHPKIRIVLMIGTVLFILCAIFYEPMKSRLITSYQPSYTSKPTGRLYRPVSYNLSKVKPVTMSQVIHARLHSKDIHVAGQIIDPDAHMRLPIGLGVGSNTLMLAAGTMRPKMKMGFGNYALAGHHMISHEALFTPLYYHARKGQMVYLASRRNIYSYQIYSRRVVDYHDVKVVNNTKCPILTLVTCNSGQMTKKRLVIQGRFKHRYPIEDASNTVKKTLAGRTNNYKVLKGY